MIFHVVLCVSFLFSVNSVSAVVTGSCDWEQTAFTRSTCDYSTTRGSSLTDSSVSQGYLSAVVMTNSHVKNGSMVSGSTMTGSTADNRSYVKDSTLTGSTVSGSQINHVTLTNSQVVGRQLQDCTVTNNDFSQCYRQG